MHAYIIVGSQRNLVEKRVQDLCSKLSAKPLEFSISKIEEVRDLNKFLSLTQPENSVIQIKDVDLATSDALNAFLKNLEEPQENITFILTAGSEHKVLPTILSRCQIIRTRSEKWEVGSEKQDEVQRFISATTGEKFKYIDKIKKREEAIDFVKNVTSAIHAKLTKDDIDYPAASKNVVCLQNTLDALNQNGNVTIHLANLIIKMEAHNI